MLLEFAKKDNFEQPQINAFMVDIGKIQINSCLEVQRKIRWGEWPITFVFQSVALSSPSKSNTNRSIVWWCRYFSDYFKLI